jgi:hypothetical protein
MNASMILGASEMSTPRLAPDFVAWVKKKAQELGASPEAKAFARSGARLPKKFYDELYPLGLFVKHEFAAMSDAVVMPNLRDKDNFDAIISFRGRADTLYVEITRAINGYDQSLRLEVLADKGSVNWTGPIRRVEGRRGVPNRIVEVQDEGISGDLLRKEHLCLVKTVVRAKANKCYGRHHLLLLVIDDFLPFSTESDLRELQALITEGLLSSDLDFVRLVVLGISGNLVLSFQLPRYARCEGAL